MSETLQELLRRVSVDDVIDALLRLNLAEDGEIASCRKVLDSLKDVEPTPGLSSIIVNVLREDDGQVWADVSGVEPGVDTTVAIEFTPWGEWLPATVIRGKDAEDISDAELAAHILWEMTWISYDPGEIAKRREALIASAESLKG